LRFAAQLRGGQGRKGGNDACPGPFWGADGGNEQNDREYFKKNLYAGLGAGGYKRKSEGSVVGHYTIEKSNFYVTILWRGRQYPPPAADTGWVLKLSIKKAV